MTGGRLWLIQFSATLAAVVLGGVILALGVRAYIYWSVKDTAQQMNEKQR